MSQVSFQGPDRPAEDGEDGEPKLLTEPFDLLDLIPLWLTHQFHAVVAIPLQALKGDTQRFVGIDPVADGVLHGLILSPTRPLRLTLDGEKSEGTPCVSSRAPNRMN
jgi:hypothetical protein